MKKYTKTMEMNKCPICKHINYHDERNEFLTSETESWNVYSIMCESCGTLLTVRYDLKQREDNNGTERH